MTQAILTVIVLIAGVIIGSMLKPTEEQLRPLTPPEAGDTNPPVAHHHH